jgi:signal transduction histidine kinase
MMHDGETIGSAGTPDGGRMDQLEQCLLRVGVLDHQVKTEATIVSGWAVLLDETWDELTEEQRREAVQVIRRRSEALAEAARSQLELVAGGWSAPPAGDLQRDDLARTLRLLAEEVAAATSSHAVRYEGPEALEWGFDRAGVERIVLQLVENAIRYSPHGSDVVVGLRDDGGGRVAIDVVDEGEGIPDDRDLFDPFVRHDHRSGGSGLGLFIVRDAVEAMGGSVTAARNPSSGSTFRVTLPAA